MKLLPLASFSFLSLFLSAAPLLHAEAADPQMIADAQAAYKRGDLEAAKRDFTLINQIDPRNLTAIQYLKMIQVREGNTSKNAGQQAALAALMVPKVNFRDATLEAAIAYLQQQVPKLSGGKQSVNFVLNLPDEVKNKPVSLSLENVPFSEVIRYLGEQANLRFDYEKYAIKVSVKSTPATTSTAAVGTPAATQGVQLLPAQ